MSLDMEIKTTVVGCMSSMATCEMMEKELEKGNSMWDELGSDMEVDIKKCKFFSLFFNLVLTKCRQKIYAVQYYYINDINV